MSDTKFTDELKQMNAYWRLLVALVTECLALGNDARLSPDAQLEQLRAKLEFARRYLRVLPPSVKAELDANPSVQAALADIVRRQGETSDKDSATYFVMDDDGQFHEMVIRPEEGLRPISDAELQALFPEE